MILPGLGLIGHRTDAFPFLDAASFALFIGMRRFIQLPSLSRWIAGYALVLFAFLFFARFLYDSYLGVIVALASDSGHGTGTLSIWPGPFDATRLVA